MNDKIKHYIVGFTLSALGILFTPLILLGFTFGIAKEIYDKYTGKGIAELDDAMATFLGSLCATVMVFIVGMLY